MKKLILPIFLMACIAASGQVYQKGSKFVNVGVGLGPGVGVVGTVDLGVHEAISVGAFGGYESYSLLGSSSYGRIGVGGRADYHLAKLLKGANLSINTDKIDPYIGANVGIGIYTGTYGSFVLSRIRPLIGGHLGARYMTKEKLGFFGEVGYDVSYLKAGITLKL